jgi:Asp-tRNA(Asn)/Glu-tRNA(Gln) amidotransferase A subunit family amidase
MRRVDVVVSPTCLTPALQIAETKGVTRVRGKDVDASSLTLKCTSIASDTGLPSISVPCGFAEGPLPIALHIMGRRLEESLILRVAHTYEQATEWHLRHPDLD